MTQLLVLLLGLLNTDSIIARSRHAFRLEFGAPPEFRFRHQVPRNLGKYMRYAIG